MCIVNDWVGKGVVHEGMIFDHVDCAVDTNLDDFDSAQVSTKFKGKSVGAMAKAWYGQSNTFTHPFFHNKTWHRCGVELSAAHNSIHALFYTASVPCFLVNEWVSQSVALAIPCFGHCSH